jgi:hypothetical protein
LGRAQLLVLNAPALQHSAISFGIALIIGYRYRPIQETSYKNPGDCKRCRQLSRYYRDCSLNKP